MATSLSKVAFNKLSKRVRALDARVAKLEKKKGTKRLRKRMIRSGR